MADIDDLERYQREEDLVFVDDTYQRSERHFQQEQQHQRPFSRHQQQASRDQQPDNEPPPSGYLAAEQQQQRRSAAGGRHAPPYQAQHHQLAAADRLPFTQQTSLGATSSDITNVVTKADLEQQLYQQQHRKQQRASIKSLMVYSSGDSGYHAPTLPASRRTPSSQPVGQPLLQHQLQQHHPLPGSTAHLEYTGSINPVESIGLDAAPQQQLATGSTYYQSHQQQQQQHRQNPSNIRHHQGQIQQQQVGHALHSTELVHQRRGHYEQHRHGSGSVFDSGEGSSSLGIRSTGGGGVTSGQHYHASQLPSVGSSSSSALPEVAGSAITADQLPRIGYLFSQNPAISASLPNYAETRTLLGSQMIDSGSLDYSVEEPLSLPTAIVSGSGGHQHPSTGYPMAGQQQQQAHRHQRQTAASRARHAGMETSGGRGGLAGSSQLNSSSLYAASPSTSNVWNMRGRIGGGSGATTAEPLPSSSTSFCWSSNTGAGPMGGNPMASGEALSRHSALPSMDSSSLAAGSERSRVRPVFQKSSSTPTARGNRDRHHDSLSPISRMQAQQEQQHETGQIVVGGDALHHRKLASRQTSSSGSYLGEPVGQVARPAQHPHGELEPQPVDEYGSEMLSRMMQQLGRPRDELQYYSQQQMLHRQQQQQQRRMLPQIPRPHSPSETHPSFLATGVEPADSGRYGAPPDVIPRHRRRRQSSLELERQQMQLALPGGFETYPDDGVGYQQHQLAFDERRSQPRQPPTISVSPEFPDDELDLEYLQRTGGYDAGVQSQRQLEHMRLAGYQTDRFREVKQQPYQQYYAQQVHHSATHHPTFLHHQHQHHHQRSADSRSMAMGSDSELNTRGLSSNKLYYVHVPPARRSHRHQRQQPSGGSQQHRHRPDLESAPMPPPQMVQPHHHQRQLRLGLDDDDAMPMEGFNPVHNRDKLAGDLSGDPMNPELLRRTGRHLSDTAHRSHPAVHLPDYSMVSTSNIRPGQPMVASSVAISQEMVASEQQAPRRQSKGVTFDGRTSAPVYGRRKREMRERYLRTNSEEYGHTDSGDRASQKIDTRQMARQPGGQHSGAEESENEDRSSSIASRTSNASYAGSTDQHPQSRHHQVGRRSQRAAITASEFNITGTGQSLASDSWLAGDQPHQQPTRLASGSRELRAGQGPEFPPGQMAGEPSTSTGKHSSGAKKHPSQHSSSYLEGGSVSDTGGAASISDKEANSSQATALGGSTGTPPGNKSERRARVRDNQQSSNERSIGDGAGSSQSLKSQMGPGTGSGGLSKKSNSTTQLSLSGKCLTRGFSYCIRPRTGVLICWFVLSGTKKRLGFRKKQVTLFSVHRSEEVVPQTARHLVKQATSVSSDGEGSLSNESGAK